MSVMMSQSFDDACFVELTVKKFKDVLFTMVSEKYKIKMKCIWETGIFCKYA